MSSRRMVIGVGVLAALVGLSAALYAFRGQLVRMPLVGSMFQGVAHEHEGEYWTCVMHPEVQEAGPGRCPYCGMELVPASSLQPQEPRRPGQAPDGAHAAPEPGGAPGGMAMDGSGAASPGHQAEPRVEVSIDSRRRQLIGVRTVAAERADLARTIRAVGVVQYDETRLSDVNVKLEGWVRELHVDYTGKFIERGQPLFTLYSPELVATQNEYLLALRTRDQLSGSPIEDAREYSGRMVESARQRLELWDLPADQLDALEKTRQPHTTMLFRSPVTGYVIEKRVLEGMRVMPGESLYKVANLSTVWIEADLYEQEIPLVRTGGQATVTLDAYPGESFAARVIYIYPFVEERTRTVKVRFSVPNRGNRFKPGMYANVGLHVPIGEAITVPSNAVLDSGRQQIVFVAEGDGYFMPRPVTVGQRLEDRVAITEGLADGEVVATGATFFIDSESQIRASLQGYAPAPPPAASSGPAERLILSFATTPDPPRAGQNVFEVGVRDPDGRPVTDAEVQVLLFMPAMPSMNMPAMQTQAVLPHVADGLYRATGDVQMSGRWDVTVTVLRAGERIGRQQFTIVAR